MFSVGLFYISLGVILAVFGFRYIEVSELGYGAKYFHAARVTLDRWATYVGRQLVTHFSFESLSVLLVRMYHVCAHYAARVVARVSHSLEHRARVVAHRSAKRVRAEGHYLEKLRNENDAGGSIEK